MADATILQGYRKLAESQAKRADIAGEFTKALDLSGRKARKEKEIEELNQRIADRLETLDGNINLNAVDDPKLKSALSQFGTTSKYSFSDKANQVGRLNDPTSMEHMKLVDEMNGINDQFRAVRAEMDYISKMQADYLNIIDEDGGFSVGQKDTEQVKALEQIFGGGGDYSVSVKDGHIVYNVNGKDYAAKDLKLPGRKAFDQATQLMQTNAELVSMGRALNSADEQLLRTQYDSMFKTESTLRSILSDGDFGDVIPTSDIDIDDMGFEAAKAMFIDRLINANKASARRGIKTDESGTDGNDGNSGGINTATLKSMQAIQDTYKLDKNRGVRDYTPDDLKFIAGSATNPISIVFNPSNLKSPWEVTRKTLDPVNGTLSAETIMYRDINDLIARSGIKF